MGQIQEHEMAASVGDSNLMIANWVIGKRCDPEQFDQALTKTPFALVVIVLSTAVADADAICQHLDQMSLNNPENDESIGKVKTEKVVQRMSSHMFTAYHRAKVKGCTFREWSIRSHGEGVRSGTLELQLDTSRQRLERIKIGVLDGRTVRDSHVSALAEWIVLDRVAMVTGCFCDDPQIIADLAHIARAVFQMPMFQEVTGAT